MAISPAHTWGQTIGNVIEKGVHPILESIADEFDLYLDHAGPRQARQGRKVSWTDLYGNTHDLDFVFERGGSDLVQGQPVAFIEVAWRRYTKHSKNKAQEIQGAILPVAAAYEIQAPFIGAVVAGDFTEPALEQMRSVGFRLLYFDYESVMAPSRLSILTPGLTKILQRMRSMPSWIRGAH